MANGITVFLALNSATSSVLRNELVNVFGRAGMNVVFHDYVYGSEDDFKKKVSSLLPSATCSVHLIEPSAGITLQSDNTTSAAKYQFFEAKKMLEHNPDFKIFVWQPPQQANETIEPSQMAFINELRNNITKNMVFTTVGSSIQLAEDLRSIMEVKKIQEFDLSSTDVFLITNQLDETDANEITDMLSDIVPVEKLTIVQDSDTDYSELCAQQIGKSKLAVVYFKESADWALPFAQQVWKKIGGAVSHTPILLIGDEHPDTNQSKKIKAPKIISIIVAGELIPLEIKVQYDKVISSGVTPTV